jgi:carbamoyl-phosphate synthase small subunit
MSLEGFSPSTDSAMLALADGSVFQGFSVGASGQTQGEVVFNTSMTGYQEILTDPSYTQQIVTLTYPHIGNTGINPDDFESSRAFAAGLVIRECSPIVSHWRATQSLPDFLKAQGIVAIAGVDTRRLTRLLSAHGAQNGCIMTGDVDPDVAIQKARAFPGLNGKDLAIAVTTQKSYDFAHDNAQTYHVVVVDYGVKYNILRLLAQRHCRVTVVPATLSAKEILALNPSGVVLSNGPGDPAACDYAIKTIRELLTTQIPLFGICLGFQLLALACGAKTRKMKFGHHGANHPVQDIRNQTVYITSQNHGFCVDIETLPNELIPTHISLFDKTLQGFKHKVLPVIAFQGHPEAAPGPNDIVCLFDEFMRMIEV